MCQAAISLITKALHEVDNAEMLLKIKGVLALFIQTMEVCLPSKPDWTHLTQTTVLGLSGWYFGYFLTYTV